MGKYKIGFADEELGEIVDFTNFIEEDPQFELHVIESLGAVEEIVQVVMEHNLDAVIIDFKLKQFGAKFQENGEAYIKHLSDTFDKFPCFLLTNNSVDAKKYSNDPFRVFSKSLIHLVPGDSDYVEAEQLREDIKTYINNYYSDLREKEEKLLGLLKKKHEGVTLSASEEGELFDLDRAISNSILRAKQYPIHLGLPEKLNGLDELIKQTKQLIGALKGNQG